MKTLSASSTVTIQGLAMRKRAQGEHVYNFAAGDPVLSNHQSIIHRAMKHMEKGVCPYPPIDGIPELRRLAVDWMNTVYHTQYSPANTLVTCGGKFALFAIMHSLLQANDEVLILAPYWVSYPDIVKMGGGIPKIVPTSSKNDWKVTGKDLLQHATKNAKILIFNNACNPTGVLYSEEEIKEILVVAKNLGLIVVSDEVYSGLVYESNFVSCGAFPEHKQRVIVVQSCSKNFGMTGWRVGFVFAMESVIKRLSTLQSQSTTGTPLASQWAAVGAMENNIEVNNYVKEAMRQRRDLFVDTFNSLFPTHIERPKSALYAFVPLSSMGIHHISNSALSCEKLIATDNIALVPGSAFGAEGYIRFAFTESEENIYRGLHHLQQAVYRLVGGKL